MKRFKRQSDLIKHACKRAIRNVFRRQADKARTDEKKFLDALRIKDFLAWAEMKLRLPR